MARPWLDDDERESVLAVLSSGQLAAGPRVHAFEEALAGYLGREHVVATSSGTAALHAALLALGLGPGDKVLTTPFTFVATANAILYAGATPVFVDIDPLTYNLDPAALAGALDRHPDARAVLVVHLYGLAAAMPMIAALAGDRNLWLIEDCAQAVGAAVGGQKVGTFGQVSAFSFYATKNMTTGEGGAVACDDPALAERVRALINHGQRDRYRHETLGYNLRMAELPAALGLAQLARLPEMNRRRQAHAAYYDRHITHPGLTKPWTPPGYEHVYHHYTLRVADRPAFRRHMAERGVSTDVHYPATIMGQPLYARVPFEGGPCPAAEAAAREVVSIPVHPLLSEDELDRVSEAVNAYDPQRAPESVGDRDAGGESHGA